MATFLLFMFLAGAAGTSIASGEQCDARGTSGCVDQDTQSALQAHVSIAVVKPHDYSPTDEQEEPVELRQHREAATHAQQPECIAAALSMSTYSGTAPNGYTVVQTYSHSSPSGDEDKAVWYQKAGACWLVFMGSGHQEDFMNNYNFKPMDKWGIPGVHSGVVAELEPLLNQMKNDYNKMRSNCTGALTVTGHSLGGALAQLFSMAVNKQDDPLGANLKVDFLYTIGAMAVTDNKEGNDKSPDGCFAGAQYWYAEKQGTTYVVDVVALPFVGGQNCHVPAMSAKVLVFADGTKETFPCGKALPSAQSLFMTKGSMSAWLPFHVNYVAWLGC